MGLLWIVSFIWAFSFPLIKGNLGGLDAAFVSLVRLSLSLLVFAPLLRLRAVPRGLAPALVAVGGVQFGLMYVLYIESFSRLPAHTVVLLTTTTPLLVALLDELLDRRVRMRTLCAALLAVAAGAVIQYPVQPLRASLVGVALVQGSNVAFAAGQVAYRRLAARAGQWDDARVFALLYLGAVLVSACCAVFRRQWMPATLSGAQMMTLVYLGVVASGIGFFLWNRGARQVGGAALAVMNNVKIPLGIIASLALLHERTDLARLAAGMAFMACALALCARGRQGSRQC